VAYGFARILGVAADFFHGVYNSWIFWKNRKSPGIFNSSWKYWKSAVI